MMTENKGDIIGVTLLITNYRSLWCDSCLHRITHQGPSSITLLFLLFLPLLFVFVTTTVFVCTIVSASLLVLTALFVTVMVCLIVGLLLLVTAIVMFVFGEPISEMPTLDPVC